MRRRGIALLELTVALALTMAVVLGGTAILLRQANDARAMYEERVAWEAAAGRLAELEASGFDAADGTSETPLSGPGTEHLRDRRATIAVERVDGARRVTVEVAWTSFRGHRRFVRAATLAGGRP